MPDIVALFLVDGLNYGDVLQWECARLQPCFVDGPSVTFRLYPDKRLNPTVGFASIISRPSIHQRLYAHGFQFPRGYTYWSPESNIIADYMFEGIPYRRVANFESVLRSIAEQPLEPQSYLQIVREGLDGLAHKKRELHRIEVDSAVTAIYDDVSRLMELLTSKGHQVLLYLTSDHGILWKNEHEWKTIHGTKDSHARFAEQRPTDASLEYVVRFENELPYYLFRYPCLGARIPGNDSGVHGGLSYQESITPLAVFKG